MWASKWTGSSSLGKLMLESPIQLRLIVPNCTPETPQRAVIHTADESCREGRSGTAGSQRKGANRAAAAGSGRAGLLVCGPRESAAGPGAWSGDANLAPERNR